MNRRQVLGSAFALSGFVWLSACNFSPTVRKRYFYEIAIIIDGQALTFFGEGYCAAGNVGSLGGQSFHDNPQWSAARLPSGEMVLLRPATLTWPFFASYLRSDYPEALSKLASLQYASAQRPLVFVFDPANAAERCDCFGTPFSFGAGSRVQFVSAKTWFVDESSPSPAPTGPIWSSILALRYLLRGMAGWVGSIKSVGDAAPPKAADLGLPEAFTPFLQSINSRDWSQASMFPNTDRRVEFCQDPRVAKLIKIDQRDIDNVEMPERLGLGNLHDRLVQVAQSICEHTDEVMLGSLQFRRQHGAQELVSVDGRFVLHAYGLLAGPLNSLPATLDPSKHLFSGF